MFDGCVLGNIDLKEALGFHNMKKADITVLYKTLDNYKNSINALNIFSDSKNRIIKAQIPKEEKKNAKTSFGIYIFTRDILIKTVKESYQNGGDTIEKDIIEKNISKLAVYGFEHKGFAAVADSVHAFINANRALLYKNIRNDLFNINCPVFTRTKDDMPTRYGINAKAENSLIAEGCLIEGSVKNSVIFRGVKIEEGAVVEDSVLFDNTAVCKGSKVRFAVADKNTVFGENKNICGNENSYIITTKNSIF